MNTTNEDGAPLQDSPISQAERDAAAADMRRCQSPVADAFLELLTKLYGGAEGLSKVAPYLAWIAEPTTLGITRTIELLKDVTKVLRKREWGTDMTGLSLLALALRKELAGQFETLGIDRDRIPEFFT